MIILMDYIENFSRIFTVTFCIAAFICSPAQSQQLKRYSFQQPKMGTLFQIICYAPNSAIANAATDSAFQRIEELNDILSDYKRNSELNRLSRTSGSSRAVPVSDDLFYVLKKAQQIARQTQGAFDVTIGPYTHLWRELAQQEDPKLPAPEVLDKLAKSVGYKHLILNQINKTALLEVSNMQLDLGGVAKGYALDEALEVLRHFGIESALINGGGDIAVSDAPPGEKGWTVALPHSTQSSQNEPVIVTLANNAIATSGDLFKFIKIDGIKYSHIIDPATGLGLTAPIKVSVIAPTGIMADALASAVSVLSPQRGLVYIRNKENTAVYIEVNRDGVIKVVQSKNFSSYIMDLSKSDKNQ